MIQSPLRKIFTTATFALSIVMVGVQSAHAEDLKFTLQNKSSSPLVEFYVESTELNHWGENILSSSIDSGESGDVTIADGKTTCSYGIRGVFADGSTLEQENLNLCEMGSYTYTDKK